MNGDKYQLLAETDSEPNMVIIQVADLETICAALHSLTQYSHKLYGLSKLEVKRV